MCGKTTEILYPCDLSVLLRLPILGKSQSVGFPQHLPKVKIDLLATSRCIGERAGVPLLVGGEWSHSRTCIAASKPVNLRRRDMQRYPQLPAPRSLRISQDILTRLRTGSV